MTRPNFEKLDRDQLLHLVETLDRDAGRSRFAEIRAWQAEHERETRVILCRECEFIEQALGIPTITPASREA